MKDEYEKVKVWLGFKGGRMTIVGLDKSKVENFTSFTKAVFETDLSFLIKAVEDIKRKYEKKETPMVEK